MEEVKKRLEAREKYLSQLRAEKLAALEHAPTGFLRICSDGGRTQYYKKEDSRERSGRYLKKNEEFIAQELAQRDYDKKVLRTVEKELHTIQKYLADYPSIGAEQIYEHLHKERQKLVVPIQETEQTYIQNWESVSYKGKDFAKGDMEFYTAKGERVRSKSEVIIADLLGRNGIPYRYEYPLWTEQWGTIYPDFTILHVKKRKEIIWEHLGMMDNALYAEKAIHKLWIYEQNGIYPGKGLILTYETQKNPIHQKRILSILEQYLY